MKGHHGAVANIAIALALALGITFNGSGTPAQASKLSTSERVVAQQACMSFEGPGIPPPSSVPSGIPGFHASWYGQSGYMTLCPGDTRTATVAIYNSGSLGWVSGRMGEVAYLGTWEPSPGQDQPSAFGGDGTLGSPATGWPRYNRPAVQPHAYVGPNQVAWFQFNVRAPASPGTYRLYIRPLIEGATWMEDYGIYWQFTVPAPTPDTTAPSVTGAASSNASTVLVSFSEPMNCAAGGGAASIATGTNYSFTTSPGGAPVAETVTASPNAGCTQATLSLAPPLTLGAQYTVTVSNVQDQHGNTIGPNRSATFTAADTAAPTATAQATGSNQITVTYSEPMDQTTTGNATNYRFDSVSCTTACAALTTSSTTAVLTLTTPPTPGDHALDISNVKDTAGTFISPDPTSLTVTFPSQTARPTVTGASATNASMLNVTYSTNMDPISTQTAANYTVQNPNGTTYSAVTTATCSPGTTTCTAANLTLAVPLVSGPYNVVISNVKDSFGNFIDPNPTIRSFHFTADTSAPSVSSVSGSQTATNTGQLVITFSEAMKHVLACGATGAPQTGTGPNIDSKGNYTVTSGLDAAAMQTALQASTTATLSANCRSVTLVLTGSFSAGPYTMSITSAQDAAGNTVPTTTTSFTYTDTIAPTLSSVSGVSATSLTANYSKRMVGGTSPGNSAGNPSNYQVNNNGYGNLCQTGGTAAITASADLKSFTVTCTGANGRWTTTGGNTLTVKDVADYNGNVISPNPTSVAF